VLFMSAHPAEVLVQEGLDHPRVYFLAKPFTRSELMNKVEAAVTARPVHEDASSGNPRTPT
jgi:DNA-binding response OmpR family regulator